MTDRAIPWLPSAQAGEFEKVLVTLAEAWLSEWIAGPQICRIDSGCNARNQSFFWCGAAGAAVGAGNGDLAKLGSFIIGDSADIQNMRDREILTCVGKAAIGNLAAALCDASGQQGGDAELPEASIVPENAAYRLTNPAKTWSIELALNAATVVQLRKRHAGSKRSPVLSSLADALAPESARLGCHLGEALLTAAQVGGMAKGDLIVLNRRLGDSLPLTVEGVTLGSGTATIGAGSGTPAIRITQAPNLTAQAS